MLVLAGPPPRSYSTFTRLATSCSGTPCRWEQARRSPEPGISTGEGHTHTQLQLQRGYPARGSGSNLIHSLERSIGGR
jgi:hypothetical protein